MKTLLALSDSDAASSLSQALVSLGKPTPGIAADSDAVIEWINTNGGCDLLISEVYFAALDGFSLRDALLPYLPDLKVIFTSQHDISPYADRLGGAPFLPQPITAETLAQTLAELGFAPEAPAAPAQPKPVAAAAPKPATAAAKPQAAGAPKPQAVGAKPKAGVAAAPKAAAKPVAKGAAPAAKAAAKPAAPAKAPALPQKPDLPPDELVGKTISHFLIEARIRDMENETFYRATQTNIGRTVILRVLKPAAAADPVKAAKFMDDARAKAKVTHTLVTTVYESGQHEDISFYSNEAVAAPTLEDMIENGRKIDTTSALQIIKSVGEVFDFFDKEGIARVTLLPRHIILKPGSAPRVLNLACKEAPAPIDQQQEIQNLVNLLLPVLATDKSSAVAQTTLKEIQNADPATTTWPYIAQLAESRMPKAAPVDSDKIQSQTLARSRALEDSKKMSRKNVIIYSAVSLTLTLAACFFVIRAFTKNNVHVKDLGDMINIPAGEVSFQGQTVNVPAFKISKYEVTIAEYAAFLKDLKENPDKAAKVAHPNQPPGKSHIPTGWADMTEIDPPNPGYYTRAKRWGRYQDSALSLDSPVFGVDWYDAYAYAKWKGQRLPTEQEWERAARGDKGSKNPWGDAFDNKLANNGYDFNPDPKAEANIDGFKRWSPVDKPETDKSAFGVQGMAGNVFEWTDTWAEDEERPGDKVPVYRGSSWKTKDENTALRRGTKLMELKSDDALGFRTAEDAK
jgi:formylglycine-generating enzyme required for sulfatase activity